MSDTPDLAALLDQAGRLAGIGSLVFDAQGRCMLVCHDQLAVHLAAGDDSLGLTLTAFLGPVRKGCEEAVYGQLLDANFYWQGSAGATLSLALDPRIGVVMHKDIEIDERVDAEALAGELAGFTSAALHWQDFLDTIDPAVNGPPPAGPAMIRV